MKIKEESQLLDMPLLKKIGIKKFYARIEKVYPHHTPESSSKLIGDIVNVSLPQKVEDIFECKLLSIKNNYVKATSENRIYLLPFSMYRFIIKDKDVVAIRFVETYKNFEAIIIDEVTESFLVEYYERGKGKRVYVNKTFVLFSKRFMKNSGFLKGKQ